MNVIEWFLYTFGFIDNDIRYEYILTNLYYLILMQHDSLICPAKNKKEIECFNKLKDYFIDLYYNVFRRNCIFDEYLENDEIIKIDDTMIEMWLDTFPEESLNHKRLLRIFAGYILLVDYNKYNRKLHIYYLNKFLNILKEKRSFWLKENGSNWESVFTNRY